jgi:hypothetical protein
MENRTLAATMLLLVAASLGACGGEDEGEAADGPAGADAGTAPARTDAGAGTGTAGQRTCAQLQGCYEACADETCALGCYGTGTPQAKAQDDTLWACIWDHGCEDATCVQTACPDEVAACEGGEPDPAGPPTEAAYWKCTAEGIVTVCSDGGSAPEQCDDQVVSMMGLGDSETLARTDALVNCSDHLMAGISIGNMAGRATTQVDCAVTSCRRVGG